VCGSARLDEDALFSSIMRRAAGDVLEQNGGDDLLDAVPIVTAGGWTLDQRTGIPRARRRPGT